jgi:conjugal transfer pilus assembly protein TraF
VRGYGWKIAWIYSVMLILWPLSLKAQNYYGEHAKGWHWYEEPLIAREPEEASIDPIMQIKGIKQTLEIALDEALLNPTPWHVKQYIDLQNKWSEKASQFANMWQWVLLHYPELDYSLTHPTNQVARTVYLDQVKQAEASAIKQLAQHHGLFFFYRSTCLYSQRLAPILKSFSERYHLPIVPITVDGIALAEFPQSRLDQGQASRFAVKALPALFAVNPTAHQVTPLAYGLISESDLRQRILAIAKATP